MSDQDSILRFQNALATLAEIASRHDERITKHDEIIAKHDERIAQLDKISKQHDERIANSEQAIKLLLELQRTATERADDHFAWINQLGASRAEMNERLTALTDAQIDTEEKLTALAASQSNTGEVVRQLATELGSKLAAMLDAQAVADAKFAGLAEVLKRMAEAQGRSDRGREGPAGPV